MPLRDMKCLKCDHVNKDVLIRNESDMDEEVCKACGCPDMELQLSFPATYTITGNNSASVRPKRMGGGKGK